MTDLDNIWHAEATPIYKVHDVKIVSTEIAGLGNERRVENGV